MNTFSLRKLVAFGIALSLSGLIFGSVAYLFNSYGALARTAPVYRSAGGIAALTHAQRI